MASEAPCGRIDPLLRQGFVEPLLLQLAAGADQARRGERRRPVLGLQGPVGAGKSTLAGQLEALAPAYGLRLAVASIDDLYRSWPERRERLAGNPFAVSRVPPGSHDIPLLLNALQRWRAGEELVLPRFDKRLEAGQGDRCGWRRQACDALLLEGWLLGCRPLPEARLQQLLEQAGVVAGLREDLARVVGREEERRSAGPAGSEESLRPPAVTDAGSGAPRLQPAEWAWLPRWNRELQAYLPLWEALDGLWILRPLHWGLPRRWRFQAEARQRHRGGGWLPTEPLEALVRASLCSLPPALYLDPLLPAWALGEKRDAPAAAGPFAPAGHAAGPGPLSAASHGTAASGRSSDSAPAMATQGGSGLAGEQAGELGLAAESHAAAGGSAAAAATSGFTPAQGNEAAAAARKDFQAPELAGPAQRALEAVPGLDLGAAHGLADQTAGRSRLNHPPESASACPEMASQPPWNPGSPPQGPLVQAVAVLDGRRRCRAVLTPFSQAQSSSDSSASATG